MRFNSSTGYGVVGVINLVQVSNGEDMDNDWVRLGEGRHVGKRNLKVVFLGNGDKQLQQGHI